MSTCALFPPGQVTRPRTGDRGIYLREPFQLERPNRLGVSVDAKFHENAGMCTHECVVGHICDCTSQSHMLLHAYAHCKQPCPPFWLHIGRLCPAVSSRLSNYYIIHFDDGGKLLLTCMYLIMYIYGFSVPDEKLGFELELGLVSSHPWVTAPKHLCMWSGGIRSPHM